MDIWTKLILNLAVVGLFVSVWILLSAKLTAYRRQIRHALFGVVMGGATIASMMMSIPMQGGVIFDLRNSLICIAALFGGPVAMVPSALMAASYRLSVGGAGSTPALMTIALAAALGLAGYYWSAGRPGGRHVLVISVGSGLLILLGLLALPHDLAQAAMASFAVPVSVLTGVLTASGSWLMVQAGQVVRMRDLLHAALVQAPDFQYVKDTRGRFVAVNDNVVHHHGQRDAADLIGKTDADFADPQRAAELVAGERRVMDTGTALLNFEEQVTLGGSDFWFITSKLALRDHDGQVIGLSGVTRDVTQWKQLEAELRQSRDTMAFIMAHMSDGVAMFDRDADLVFCNDQYRSAFPLTAALRQPGTNLRTILEAVVDTGEQLSLGGETGAEWIELVMRSLESTSEEQVKLYDGRWLHVRTRPAENGNALVVVSDVTTIKRSEQELQRLTGELQTLASTDGLTGLLNRRSFDDALALELSRSADLGRPLSLLMIDVDRFKGFNDHYGHPAGDDCLKRVAACLRSTLRRTGDVVARYGGEEFVAILIDTDESSAFAAAERFRKTMAELQMPNVAGEAGIVTVSIGIACTGVDARGWTPERIVARADEALYAAKGGGRNRVNGWRPAE